MCDVFCSNEIVNTLRPKVFRHNIARLVEPGLALRRVQIRSMAWPILDSRAASALPNRLHLLLLARLR